MNTSDIVRENVKRLLKEKNETQINLANFLTVSTVYLNDLLAGRKGSDLRISMIEKFADFFNIEVNHLMIPLDSLTIKKIQPDKKLSTIQEKINNIWIAANSDDKGYLSVRFEQIFAEYNELLKRRSGIEVLPPPRQTNS